MKKLFFSSLILLTGLLIIPSEVDAKEVTPTIEMGVLAKCTIKDPGGFYARGNCRRVMKWYREWKEMQ